MSAAPVFDLDRLVHEPARLGIVSILASRREATFGELKDLVGLTDGNLSVHLRTLETAGYVEVRKRFDARRPRTTARLTRRGRAALERYLAALEAVLRAAREES